MNSPAGIVGATPQPRSRPSAAWGFPVTRRGHAGRLRSDVGEKSLFYRTGGAPSLALGMAHIFARAAAAGRCSGFWYHFAIMFEALFILTIIDAGTRVGRFMLQDLLGHVCKPLGRTSWMPGVIADQRADRARVGIFPVSGRASIRWAASTRCGRCSASRINCWPRSRCASRPRFSSRCTARATCGSLWPAGLAGDRDVYGVLSKNLR